MDSKLLGRGGGVLFAVLNIMAHAASEPLPEPLSLQQALALADNRHPDLLLAQNQLQRAEAGQALEDAEQSLQVNLDLAPQVVRLSGNGEVSGDSYLSLNAAKKLYDFGYSAAREQAADKRVLQYRYQLSAARAQYQLEVARAFYAVILADLRYTYEDEEMSQFYVKYDRLRERYSLGMVSEVDMLAAKNRYSEHLAIRTESERLRRVTRQALALKLNRPQQLPGELSMPKLPNKPLAVPEYEVLYPQALKSNPQLAALREKLNSVQQQWRASRKRFNPELSALFELNEYERELNSRSDMRIGLQLRVPLYSGGRQDALSRLAYSDYIEAQQQLQQAEFALRRELLTLQTRLLALATELRTAQERLVFQDRNLDRQRAVYELEIQASIGSAMSRLTNAEWQLARVQIDMLLLHMQLNILLGKPLTSEIPL